MKQDWSGLMTSLLLLSVATGLSISAWMLPGRPYTGALLRGGRVVEVLAGSPAARAGIVAGDNLRSDPMSAAARPHRGASPLLAARPGSPVVLERVRGQTHDRVWLVPGTLPPDERRMIASLLVVACGFVLLAGLVWSERRDRMTRTFVLLCASFAWMLAPLPRGLSGTSALVSDLLYGAVTLFLPALFIHFFAQFPEPRRMRGARRTLTLGGYIVAAALLAGSLASQLPSLPSAWAARLMEWIDGAAALWFAGGLAIAFVLFLTTYATAHSADERRRLRVALFGTFLGAAPLVAVTLVRNMSPTTAVPFERLAVLFTLLVPASFAWAIAVHRLFDFSIALRAGAAAGVLALGGVLAVASAEWPAASRTLAGVPLPSVALAGLALGAVIVGPLNGWWRGRHASLPPALAESFGPWSGGAPRAASARAVLDEASRTLADALRLDGCAALYVEQDALIDVIECGATRALRPWCAQLPALVDAIAGPRAVDELGAASDVRAALESGGVRWLVPVGSRPLRAVLLLGRRLTGPWLGRLELREIERLTHHLDVALENVTLRDAARHHGALDRDLVRAAQVQARRLPRHAPAYPTLDCAAAALSSEAVGGDYFDFLETAPREVTLAVGDAAGKGVSAALVLAGVQGRFRTEAVRAASPAALLTALNRDLVAFDQPDRFMALLCARFDVREARLRVANAGLTPPLVRRADGQIEEVPAAGLLLGVSAEARYAEVDVALGAGDVVVLYTDGLSEARQGDRMFGVEGIRRVLDASGGRRAADILESLLREVRGFATGALDDVTILVLRQLTQPAALPGRPPHFALKPVPSRAESIR